MCFYLTAVNILVPYVRKETLFSGITVAGLSVMKAGSLSGYASHDTNAIIHDAVSYTVCFLISWFLSSITPKM